MKNTACYQKITREIMGKNFFGVEDWSALYGVNFSQKQLRRVAEFPWSEDILNSTCPLCGKVVKDCHFAFVGLDRINGKPLTILKLQELHPATKQPKFYSYAPSAWYSEKKFAKETTMDFRWYLLSIRTSSRSPRTRLTATRRRCSRPITKCRPPSPRPRKTCSFSVRQGTS